MCSVKVQTMYYYFPEGFPVKVKTQRAWRKQHFFGKATFWVSTFLPLLSAELWTHFGVRKQYSTIASPNQSVSDEISFASHSICDEKILRRTLKGKRKRHEDSFTPQSNWASFSLHRGTKLKMKILKDVRPSFIAKLWKNDVIESNNKLLMQKFF